MLRLLVWIAILVGLAYVLESNMPIPGIPAEEVVYTTAPPVAGCGAAGCTVVYALDLANAGRSAQDVQVRLRGDALGAPIVAPTVRRATDAAPANANDHAGVQSYTVARLVPEERASLVFALHAPARDAALGWDRLLVSVDSAGGVTRPGEVGAISAVRLVNGAARMVARLVRAVSAR